MDRIDRIYKIPTLGQRLRRFLLDGGSRPLDLRHPAARALLALLALGVVAVLAAAARMAYMDNRNAAVVVTDPRELYVSAVRQKIQSATETALAETPRRSPSSSALLVIRVSHRGTLISTTMKRSSGDAALDDLALRVVRQAAPFEPFPPGMRRTTNMVEIASEFVFK